RSAKTYSCATSMKSMAGWISAAPVSNQAIVTSPIGTMTMTMRDPVLTRRGNDRKPRMRRLWPALQERHSRNQSSVRLACFCLVGACGKLQHPIDGRPADAERLGDLRGAAVLALGTSPPIKADGPPPYFKA